MWNKITIKQFHVINHIDSLEIEPLEKLFKKLEVLGYNTKDSIDKLEMDIKFLDKLPPKELSKVYTINKVDYYPHLDFIRMTPARFLDLILQVKGKDPNDVSEWAYLVALLLSEHGEPYDYSTHIDRAEVFYEHMTYEQVYPLVCFFLSVWNHLLIHIKDSSMEKLHIQVQELMNEYSNDIENLQPVGDGLVI